STGQQGGSVIDTILKGRELSSQYRIRTLTRDSSKPAAKRLAEKGIEVIQGDLDDVTSLEALFKDAHTVFALTETVHDDQMKTRDYSRGKALVDAAIAANVQFYIYSTLPHIAKNSHGKYKHGDHFDVKSEVEDCIRAQPIKSAFVAPGSFMQIF
ncbi:NmrA-like domain-containing protein, partial [Emericellopsis atlantica]